MRPTVMSVDSVDSFRATSLLVATTSAAATADCAKSSSADSHVTSVMAPEDTSPSPGPPVDASRGSTTPASTGSDVDVRPFDGKIVYNPDGSAYIIDAADDVLPLATEPGSIVEARGLDGTSRTTAALLPRIAAAFYISRNPSAVYSAALFNRSMVSATETSSSSMPVVHSYRVFSARDDKLTDGECGVSNQSLQSRVTRKLLPLVDCSTVPIKPILMCFVCKLSFGSVKPFVAHALGDHDVALNDSERDILCQHNTSAIVVSVGDGRGASVSFLEPTGGRANTAADAEEPDGLRHSPENRAASSSAAPTNYAFSTSVTTAGLDLSLKSPPAESDSPVSTSLAVTASSMASTPTAAVTSLATLPSVPTVTGTTIGACPQHMNGRPADEECVECDQIMSFTRSLGGQMALMHSRNSCKTLKCPKCNWHYKYQETLEIHMKEKHPDNDTSCVYCITGQPHPRLARGETYTCGYKPYRCEVCNYSTTTKGNLSIHMQSDKHLNNMQELQNGSASRDHQRSVVPGHSTNHNSLTSAPQSRSPVQLAAQIAAASAAKPKQTFRCDVCNYETNVARNLRIHMTSEKHTHNIMVMQQNVKQIHLLSALQQQISAAGGGPGGAAGFDATASMMQLQAAALMAADKTSGSVAGGSGTPSGHEAAIADLAYNQAMIYRMMAASGGASSMSAAKMLPHPSGVRCESMTGTTDTGAVMATAGDRLESTAHEPVDLNPSCVFTCCTCSNYSSDSVDEMTRHLNRDRSQTRDSEVTMYAAGNSICRLCSYKTNLKANFQLHCKTDKHLQKLQHLNHIFEGGPANEWKLRYLNITNPTQLRCNICEFFTNSVHKLQMHSTQQRHEVALVLFNYLRRADRQTPSSPASGSVGGEQRRTYSCSLCDFSTVEKLPLLQHIRSAQHLHMEQLRQLQRQTTGHVGHDDISTIFPVHVVTDSPTTSDDHPTSSSHAAESDGASMSTEDAERSKESVASMDYAMLTCPSCGQRCDSSVALQKHFVDVHNASEEVVRHLMTLMAARNNLIGKSSKSVASTSDNAVSEVDKSRSDVTTDHDSIDVNDHESEEIFRCQTCTQTFGSVDDLCRHQHEHGLFDIKQTPRGLGYLCSKKGCNQYFTTAQQMETHFREIHARAEQIAAISERHVYKYRCSQCSLAFKTVEKLELHSQYHMIRDASKCSICDRSFRSVLSLHRHLETSHADLGEDELEKLKARVMSNPMLLAGLGGQVQDNQTRSEESLSASTSSLPVNSSAASTDDADDEREQMSTEQRIVEDRLNSPSAAEDGYNDVNRRFKCHRCRVAYTRQAYLVAHNKTLLHRKGEKLSYPMEKYLDPNRPFKCDVCKESFTQKNILLVHYNSVSHLHKLKKSMQEHRASPNSENTSPPASSISKDTEEERKSFRCNLCQVSFSNSHTLDCHVRSVMHQSRIARVPELIASGVVDTSKPFIEAPESVKIEQQQQSQQQLQDQQQSTMQDVRPMETQCKQDTSSEPVLNELPTCQQCSAVFITTEQLQQHQDLYCMLGMKQNSNTPAPSQTPETVKPKATEEADQCTRTDRPASVDSFRSLPHVGTDGAINREDNISPSFSDCTEPQKTSTPLRKSSHFQKRLLQDYGFEVVMQYNEYAYPVKKQCLETNVDSNGDQMLMDFRMDMLAEQSGCLCALCHKRFSNIWILKSHYEEVHNNIVPQDLLEEYASKFKREYIKRNVIPSITENEAKMSSIETTKDVPITAADVELKAEVPNHIYQQNNSPHSSPSVLAPDLQSNASGQQSNSLPELLSTGSSSVSPSNQARPTSPQQTQLQQQQHRQQQHQTNHPDVAATLNLLQAAHLQQQMQQQMNPLMMAQLASMGVPVGAFNPALAAMNLQPPIMPMLPQQQMFDPMVLLAMQAQALVQQQQQQQQQQHQQGQQQQQQQSQPIVTPTQHKPMGANPMLNSAILQHQLAGNAGPQPKRARTRITDEQLKILRAHFDINNSPSEDQINNMAQQTALMPKVIKHWFRNTLFKERQRNKDSPYNFSVPPATTFNLEEYEKTGEAKVSKLISTDSVAKVKEEHSTVAGVSQSSPLPSYPEKADSFKPKTECSVSLSVPAVNANARISMSDQHNSPSPSPVPVSGRGSPCSMSISNILGGSLAQDTADNAGSSLSQVYQTNLYNQQASFFSNVDNVGIFAQSSTSGAVPSSTSNLSKRANRTRFTDYQIKVLQEFFENNAYPKDDDLEYLSKMLSLSPRVIVVWFQNARQKARKTFENQAPAEGIEDMAGRFQLTAGLNYQCKKCMMVFQRYYELIRHQKQHCFKEESAKKSANAQVAASQVAYAKSDNSDSESIVNNVVGAKADSVRSVWAASPSERFSCNKCSLEFDNSETWREHQLVHLMNPSLVSDVGKSSDMNTRPVSMSMSVSPRRRTSEDESEQDLSDTPRDKHLRTIISPEQMDFLYKKYQTEPNPSRKMLETIANEIGLRKRVVQVWFQNTRARGRKGQFRAHTQMINKRCLFCPAIFRVKSALESHLATKHSEQLGAGEINIDALPDIQDDPMSDAKSHSDSGELDLRSSSAGSRKSGAVTTSVGETPLDLSLAVREAKETTAAVDYNAHDDDSNFGADATRVDFDTAEADWSSNTGSPASSTAGTGVFNMHQLLPLQSPLSRPNKRFRTQMSRTQVKLLKSVFTVYKTPTMSECEQLGAEIGLTKRVIQVWFQNARAKCKKHSQAHGVETEASSLDECLQCGVRYSHKYAVQDHIFTRSHIERVRAAIEHEQKKDTVDVSQTATLGVSDAGSGTAATAMTTAARTPTLEGVSGLALANKNVSAIMQQLYGEQASPSMIPSTVVQRSNDDPSGSGAGSLPGSGGTPLHMLAIPASAAGELRTALLLPGVSRASFSVDGRVTSLAASGDAALPYGVMAAAGDTAAVCKHCHVAFASMAQLQRHQLQLPLSCGRRQPPVGALLLTQLHYSCLVCAATFATCHQAACHVAASHGGADAAGKLSTLLAQPAEANGGVLGASLSSD